MSASYILGVEGKAVEDDKKGNDGVSGSHKARWILG